jgi:hypothetical protein
MRFHEDLWLGGADDRLPLMLLVGGQRTISEGHTLGLLGSRKCPTGRHYKVEVFIYLQVEELVAQPIFIGSFKNAWCFLVVPAEEDC